MKNFFLLKFKWTEKPNFMKLWLFRLTFLFRMNIEIWMNSNAAPDAFRKCWSRHFLWLCIRVLLNSLHIAFSLRAWGIRKQGWGIHVNIFWARWWCRWVIFSISAYSFVACFFLPWWPTNSILAAIGDVRKFSHFYGHHL
jgi:hypothetical protein